MANEKRGGEYAPGIQSVPDWCCSCRRSFLRRSRQDDLGGEEAADANTQAIHAENTMIAQEQVCSCTSMGRVLLSGLQEQDLQNYLDRVEVRPFTPNTIVDKQLVADMIRRVRLRGFALVDQGLELGLSQLRFR